MVVPFLESHFQYVGPPVVPIWLVLETNHCQYVMFSTNIVMTFVSMEYLWPTALKELDVS